MIGPGSGNSMVTTSMGIHGKSNASHRGETEYVIWDKLALLAAGFFSHRRGARTGSRFTCSHLRHFLPGRLTPSRTHGKGY